MFSKCFRSPDTSHAALSFLPALPLSGNCDIKNLSRGCKIYFPVFVEGANLSMGDMHFSQGDGEVSFCGAIEMAGFLELKCDIIRGGMKQYLTPCGPTPLHVHPIFEIGPLEPRFSEWLVFEGVSVDETGKQHYLDVSVAYKRAVLACIDYLSKFGCVAGGGGPVRYSLKRPSWFGPDADAAVRVCLPIAGTRLSRCTSCCRAALARAA